MRYNSEALSRLADKLLNGKGSYDKLKEIGNKRNYPYKVQKLKQRLTEEYKFWVAKGSGNRLQDVEKDVKYISSMLDKDTFSKEDKAKIDQLTQKYPIE
jgi:hypothetical protein